jgi:hypothetical protein
MAIREASGADPGANQGIPTMTRPDLSTRMPAIIGWRRSASLLVGAIVVVALAIPAFAAGPSASPSTSSGATPPRAAAGASEEPDESPGNEGGKPDKTGKGNETPEVAITLRGTIARTTDADGNSAFTLASGGKTYGLEAGPPWFWGPKNPLAPFAGKTVTITGETQAGSTDVDVLTVDGTTIRAPGKPPWAGGWRAVGSKHPGWSQEKADKFKAKAAAKAPTASPAIPRGD